MPNTKGKSTRKVICANLPILTILSSALENSSKEIGINEIVNVWCGDLMIYVDRAERGFLTIKPNLYGQRGDTDGDIGDAMPRDLSERAQDFREQWLARSGGWLSELVITLSDLTGIWDIIILSGIFVGSWIVLRTSPMEISLILGFAFDLAIPLQYHNDEELSSRQEVHLQNYWPTFMIGCIVEGVSFFLLHPDLFTLIVCIKTTFCLCIWLSKDQEGLQIKPRRDFKSDRDDSRSSRSRSHRSSPSDSESETVRPSHGSSSTPSHIPPCKHVPDAYKYLKRAGYDDPAIAGMVLTANQADKDKARKMVKGWASEKDPKNIERRNKEYGERARKAGWKPPPSSGSVPSDNSGGQSQMPQSKYIPDAHKYLKRAGYDDAAIAGMILMLDQIGDKDKAKQQFAAWAQEKDPKQIERRNAQYAERAAKAGWKGSSSSSSSQPSGGGSGVVDDGPPNMPTSYHIPGSQAYQALKKAGYEDVAIAGMIVGMNMGDEKQALSNFKIWTEEKDPAQIKRRNESHGKTGKEVGFPDKAKMNAAVGGSPGQRMKARLGIPVGSVNKVEKAMKAKKVDPRLSQRILEILKNPKSEKDIQRAIGSLKDEGIDIKEPEFADGFGAPDGHGGYRDIVIGEDDRNLMMRKMMKRKEFSREQVDGWERYLRQPLSRREFEEKVLPFAKRVDAFIGEGYHGTGPHQFRAKGLEMVKRRIQDQNAVSHAVIDQAILHAINKKDSKEAQNLLNKWAKDGLSQAEIQQFASATDWT